MIDSIISQSHPNEIRFDQKLRPVNLIDYIGQENIKNSLKIILGSSVKRQDNPDHLLFYGPPGLGKTTLAYIIASELKKPILVSSGPAIQRVGDLASIMTNLEAGSILFIDEIHRLNHILEEILYIAMEDGVLDLSIGKGPSSKIVRLDLPKFTLIGATTKIGSLSQAFRDRFGAIFKLDFYSPAEISQILARSAEIIQIQIESDCLNILANSSRMTPRVANRLLKRVRDLAVVKGKNIIDIELVKESLEILTIDNFGLDHSDRKFLEILVTKFAGGPVGLKTMAASLAEDIVTLEEVVEPFLLRSGFLQRTSRGRLATEKARKFITDIN